MGRPRRFKSYRITSFYIPVECEEIDKKADELAKVEKWSKSELLLHALKEYVEVHYPGNPQLILPSLLDPQALKPQRLEMKFLFRDFKRLVKLLEAKSGELGYRRDIRQKAIQQMTKLGRMNQRLKDKTVEEFIDEAEKILEEEE
jgi:hypothetical protein